MGPNSPAELKDKIRFERRRGVSDGYGNTVGDWANPIVLCTRRAKLAPLRASRTAAEPVIAARAQGVAIWDLWVRYDSGTRQVTTDDRVVDARNPSRTFNIQFVADMEDRQTWLLFQLESGNSDG